VPYFVHAYRGLIEALGLLFCRKLFVTVLPPDEPTSIVFHAAWV
jgi:hypothetical protein